MVEKINITNGKDKEVTFSFSNLFSLIQTLNSDDRCIKALEQERWADGDAICPYCGKHHCKKGVDGRFRCGHCKRRFSVLVGTIFENTKISLVKWFFAMYLISSHKKGISSHQLSRDLGVTQRTAWNMLHKIRTLLTQDESILLEADVECDEAYIGGREKNKHESKKTENNQGRSLKTKTAIFGMVQRGGMLVAKKTQDTKGNTLAPIIRQFVKPNSRIFTDEYIGYNTLYESEYSHSVVHHGAKEFVVGDSYTNTIEGFWGQLKRSIFGIYHFVSAKYLQRYVDESVFRYNTRKWDESERFRHMFKRAIGKFTYEDVKKVA